MTNHNNHPADNFDAAEAHRLTCGHTVLVVPDAGYLCEGCDADLDIDEVIIDFYNSGEVHLRFRFA